MTYKVVANTVITCKGSAKCGCGAPPEGNLFPMIIATGVTLAEANAIAKKYAKLAVPVTVEEER